MLRQWYNSFNRVTVRICYIQWYKVFNRKEGSISIDRAMAQYYIHQQSVLSVSTILKCVPISRAVAQCYLCI